MTNQISPYEPLSSENAALILVDQVGLMTGVRDYSTGELKHNVVALAKAARALKLPIIVTTTARDSMWGLTFPELLEALPGVEIIDRASVNAFDDERVARAIMGTGRKKLIFAGISLEVCAALPAMTAVNKGLDAYVAVDASGTFSDTKRQVGLLRMLQAGITLSDYATLMVESSRTTRDRRPVKSTRPWICPGRRWLARSLRRTEVTVHRSHRRRWKASRIDANRARADCTVAIFSRSIQYFRHVDGFESGNRDHVYLSPVQFRCVGVK